MATATDSQPEAAHDPDRAAAGIVEVSRTVDAPVAHVWETLISREGAAALLGEGAEIGGKGEPWHSTDGTSGVVRSYHPQEQLRVSWHRSMDAPATLVEIDLSGEGERTQLDLRHEKLDDPSLRDHLRQHWTTALDRLASAAG